MEDVLKLKSNSQLQLCLGIMIIICFILSSMHETANIKFKNVIMGSEKKAVLVHLHFWV